MKHAWSTTLLLLSLFVVAQLLGLGLVSLSLEPVEDEQGAVVHAYKETVLGADPDLQGPSSVIWLLLGVGIGTAIILLLIRTQQVALWRAWFTLAVFLALSVAFGVLLPKGVALILALALALLKVYRPGPVIHNVTELFLYAGIAVLLARIFDIFWMLVVLVAISIYDIVAVWKTKHMVRMAEFQKQSKVFAGLFLPKRETSLPINRGSSKRPPLPRPGGFAVLGGGDVAFPLLFSSVVMKWLVDGGPIILLGYTPWELALPFFAAPLGKGAALAASLTITLFATVSLFLLFYFAKKGRYYPAMPFLSAGCVVGFLVLFTF